METSHERRHESNAFKMGNGRPSRKFHDPKFHYHQQKLLTTKCIAFSAANMPGRGLKHLKNRAIWKRLHLQAKSGSARLGICARRYYIHSKPSDTELTRPCKARTRMRMEVHHA
jgi:hypothetical protein